MFCISIVNAKKQAVLRGVGREKIRRQQKSVSLFLFIWSHDKNVMPDTSGANSPPPFRQSEHAPSLLVLLYISSLCVQVCIFYIACLTECKECQAFCLFAWIGPPHPQASVAPCSPLLGPRGETHSLAGEGVGGPNSNEGTDTPVLYVYYKLLYVSLWRYTEFHTWKKSWNYTTWNSVEFRRNWSQFRTEYGIDGSKKNRRNSVSAEFHGHPSPDTFFPSLWALPSICSFTFRT